MFGIGMPELAVILVVALIVLGPKRLPEVARQLGKAMAEFRRQSSEILDEVNQAARVEEEAERAKRREAEREKLAATVVANKPVAPEKPPGTTA
jgi:Tat protein translocase TatB subunit